ncbi:MAG: hypothetical protein V4672_14545 [Verrucomicrobiota bacterium]
MSKSQPKTRLLWVCVLLLSAGILQAQTPATDEEQFKILQRDDLGVLAATVPHYRIKNLTLEEAVNHLWKEVLGRKPETLTLSIPPSAAKTSLSLDLTQTSASDILIHLAELSACHWSIKGRHAQVLAIEFAEISGIDHSGLILFAEVFILNEQGRITLGLNKDSPPDKVEKALESYGLGFGEGNHRGFANYRSEDQSLAVVVPKEQLTVAYTLVKLANAGKLRAMD